MSYKVTITISPEQRDNIVLALRKRVRDWEDDAQNYSGSRHQRMKNICLKNAKECEKIIDEVYGGLVEKV